MHNNEKLVPVVVAALAVLILGCWNPKCFQVKGDGAPGNGGPNYLWLALFALIFGWLACVMMKK